MHQQLPVEGWQEWEGWLVEGANLTHLESQEVQRAKHLPKEDNYLVFEKS